MGIGVHACACRCAGASPCLFVASARIPVNLKSNKSRQPPKLCFWQTRTWQGALSDGLRGCASAAVNQTFSITVLQVLRSFPETTGKALPLAFQLVIYVSRVLLQPLLVVESPVKSAMSTRETDGQLNPRRFGYLD